MTKTGEWKSVLPTATEEGCCGANEEGLMAATAAEEEDDGAHAPFPCILFKLRRIRSVPKRDIKASTTHHPIPMHIDK